MACRAALDGDPGLRPLRPEVHELVLDAVRAGEVALLGGQEEQALQMRAGLWLLRSHGGDELGALIDGHVHEKPPLHEGVEDPITSADASWTAEGLEQRLGFPIEDEAGAEEGMEVRRLTVRAGTRTRNLERTTGRGAGT